MLRSERDQLHDLDTVQNRDVAASASPYEYINAATHGNSRNGRRNRSNRASRASRAAPEHEPVVFRALCTLDGRKSMCRNRRSSGGE